MAKSIKPTTDLVPSYLESDFITALTKNTELMKASDTFKDYNYHGANMTMILELLSYLADFGSFHTNMVAKNVYMDSATVYETVHSLAAQKGYNATGYVSPYVTVTVTLSGDFIEGDQIYVEPWQQINTNLQTNNGDTIYYTITNDYTHTIEETGSTTSFDIYLRQGTIERLTYTGEDLVDNAIILPFHNYDYGAYPYTIAAINCWIGDSKWSRTSDFYDGLSGLLDLTGDNDDVFMFKYDKYRRYVLQFDSSRNLPSIHDDITLKVLSSLGSNGGLRRGALSTESIASVVLFSGDTTVIGPLSIQNITQNVQLDITNIIGFTNSDPSIGGANPETIQEIKVGARSNTHSQYRNITGKDYRYHLEARSDVAKGLAWGEQEIDPGNVLEYNKTYLSVIPEAGTAVVDSDGELDVDPLTGFHYPYLFALGTIDTEVVEWVWSDDNAQIISAPIEICTGYVEGFRNDLLQYLEPRKMLNNYEVPVLPDIVYFRFDIGIRVRRTYVFKDVMRDVRNKLAYFFHPYNRLFNEEISFMDVHNFILDLSITSETDDFKYIAGVDNLVLRDLGTYTTFNTGYEQEIFEPPSTTPAPSGHPTTCYSADVNFRGCFPQYKYEQLQNYMDNKLRPILLDYNQFPMLSVDMCRFFSER